MVVIRRLNQNKDKTTATKIKAGNMLVHGHQAITNNVSTKDCIMAARQAHSVVNFEVSGCFEDPLDMS